MNRGDLNRILNKLTAAADPSQYDEGRPESAKPIKDNCAELDNLNSLGKAVQNLSETIKATKDIPTQTLRIGIIKQMSLGICAINMVEFLILYCKCRDTRRSLYDLSPLEYLRKSLLESQIYTTYTGRSMAKTYLKLFNFFMNKYFADDPDLNVFCDNLDLTVIDNLTDTINEFIVENPTELIALVEFLISQEPNVASWNNCAEPKVAIIEDYLVEQGLAIGVAGILGATALGLYLRGNRAAAVTLIATATAAVGGTATGAESVMNAVDTDYNRSVRFGGQQDCRSENPTNTVGDGD